MAFRLLAVAVMIAGGLCASGVARAQMEVTVNLGLGKPTGDNSDDFGPDVGGALSGGVRTHPNFGLHFRLALDRVGVDDQPIGEASMWMGRVQVEPAAHVVQDRIDFSLGPTLGLFYLSGEFDGPGPLDREGHAWGFTFGARVNLLFRASADVAIGPYFAYDRLFANESCMTVATMAEVCDDDPDNDQGFWQIGLAATF